jgi:mycofactocin precursor
MSQADVNIRIYSSPRDEIISPLGESVMSERATTVDVIEAPAEEPELADAELLVEEVSIDGMCGVY